MCVYLWMRTYGVYLWCVPMVCTYGRIPMGVYLWVCIYACVPMGVYLRVRTYVCVPMCVYVWVCTYVCVTMGMYVLNDFASLVLVKIDMCKLSMSNHASNTSP